MTFPKKEIERSHTYRQLTSNHANDNLIGMDTTTHQAMPLSRWVPDLQLRKCRLLDQYSSWAAENRSLLQLTEEVLGSLAVLVPLQSHDVGNQFPHFVFIGLELNRQLLQAIINKDKLKSNGYSTSITVDATLLSRLIRAGLGILQVIGPLVQGNNCAKDGTFKRQSVVPAIVILQRARLVLRATLLFSYWYQTLWIRRVMPGILLEGGLFAGRQHTVHSSEPRMVSLASTYYGYRTGRQVFTKSSPLIDLKRFLLILGELLNITRPLLLATNDARRLPRSEKWKPWFLSLCLDVLSMYCLQRSGLDDAGRAEWTRRRWRLVLYALRTPFWEEHTKRTVDRWGVFPWSGLLSNHVHYCRLYRDDE